MRVNPSDVMVSGYSDTTLLNHIFDYAVYAANENNRNFINKLNSSWDEYNRLYFNNELTPAFIRISSVFQGACSYSECSNWPGYLDWFGYGGKHQIRIREHVVLGTNPMFNQNHNIDDRWRFILDVLLHEMIHQWQHEIIGYSKGNGGHDMNYETKANEIGDCLGLSHASYRRRKDNSIKTAAFWPMNVRPDGYYGDLFNELRRVGIKPIRTTAYYYERLKREAPEINDRVNSGEISIYIATIEAGIRKRPTSKVKKEQSFESVVE